MISDCWALIPIKAPGEAKTRLSTLMTSAERAQLQSVMLEDVIDGLSRSTELSGIALCGQDRATGAFAARHGLTYVPQPADAGELNAAVTAGVACLTNAGAAFVAVLPGDLPGADGRELDRAIFEVRHTRRRAIVPDRWQCGTNGLIFAAAAPPRFSFGPNSFHRHLHGDAADQANETVALHLPSFAGDIDTPTDIALFRHEFHMRRGWRTWNFLHRTVAQEKAVPAGPEQDR